MPLMADDAIYSSVRAENEPLAKTGPARSAVNRLSLALRLTVWYAATTFLLVTLVALVQYRRLAADLSGEDDQLVRETMAAVLLAGVPPTSRDVGIPGDNPIVRGLDVACHVIFGNGPTGSLPNCGAPVDEPRAVRLRDWYGAGGQHWRIASTSVAGLPNAPQARTVEVLLNRWTDEQVLAGYRRELGLLLPVILLLSAGIGFVVARRGLAPVRTLAEAVDHVSVSSLDRPVRLSDAPAEVAQLASAFDAMRERLRLAFAALTQSSTDLAHELRTPLHILRQQAEVALGHERSPREYRDVLGSSLEEYARLGRMVDDILFLARAEDPRAQVQTQALDVTQELDDVIEYLEAVAAERSVVLVADAPGSTRELQVNADRMLLRRALVNVVTNAIRHTPAWGRITLSALEHDSGVDVVIADTGVGIPPASLPRVFDRYYRVRGATTPGARACEPQVNEGVASGGEGAGLGLPIVRGIMQLHGGDVHIESIPGSGTTVVLHFPRP